MANRYWVGNGASTDWFNTNNWAATSGGTGGLSVPSGNDNVYFQGSTGNCTLTNNIICSGFLADDTYTGTFNDNGYNIECYGTLDVWFASAARISSTGSWYVKNSGTCRFGSSSNSMGRVVVESGITLTLSNYFHSKQADVMANVTVTGSRYFIIMYPTTQQPLRINPTASFPTGLSFYVNTTDIQQSGMTGNVKDFYIGYGGNSAQFILTSNMNITGELRVHAGSTSNTEAKARVFNCNGYNLNCGSIVLGVSSAPYPSGYQGAIKFGSGSHNVTGNISVAGQYTWGYVHLDTCTLNVGGTFNKDYMTVYNTPQYCVVHTPVGILPIKWVNKYA